MLLTLAGLLAAGGGWLAWALHDLPSTDPQHWTVQVPSIRITDRGGRVLYEALSAEGGRHLVVPLDQIPQSLLDATVATEDQTFYTNPGVEPAGILRALWINLTGGQVLSGGSTITQQVARTLLMSQEERSEQTYRRKLREAVLAWQLTRQYSKDQILSLYLSQTYYGGMNYGVEAAARTYFGKSTRDLTLAEAALLAGIPQTPALYNPFTDPDAALERRKIVLGLMLHQHLITQSDYYIAINEPLFLAGEPYPLEAPHFVMLVRSQIDSLFSQEQVIAHGGLVVQTSLDLNWQHMAEDAVERQLKSVAASENQKLHNMNNAAVVALNPSNGQVLAMVGSPDFFDNRHQGAINMAITPRQPGSALKPFIYALALNPSRQDPWTAATMILDVTTNFVTAEGSSYLPTNYDQQEHGPVLVRQALSSSLNIPAVITLDHIGTENLVDFFQQIGADASGLRGRDISLALGGGEISLLDLTRAYAVLANRGCSNSAVTILSVQDGDGETLYEAPHPNPVCLVDPRVAWLISDILSDDFARSLGFPANSVLNIGRPAAVKTGTTSNFHDNWTVGYTPEVVVGVWVGNASNQAMHDVTGLSGAGPIWHAVIRNLLSGSPEQEFTRPDGLVQHEICSLSGMLPSPACPYTRTEWFVDGTQPRVLDNLYVRVPIDISTGLAADADTPVDRQVEVLALDLPPSARQWARDHGLTLLPDLLQPQASTTIPAASQPEVLIQSPATGSVYIASGKVPLADQQIEVRVFATVEGSLELIWNEQVVAGSESRTLITWLPLQVGRHTLLARVSGPTGEVTNSQPVVFEVKSEQD